MSEAYHIEDEVQQKAYDSKLMRRLLHYIRPFRRMMFAATALLLASAILSNVFPLLTMRSIDWYISNPERAALVEQAEVGSIPDAEMEQALAVQRAADRQGLLRLILSLG